MNTLPYEIIHSNIIPYTYSPQSTELLSDIRNYVETRDFISTIYFEKYYELLPYEKDADKNWLLSDIVLFTKKNNIALYPLFNSMYLTQTQCFMDISLYSRKKLFLSNKKK
jgi:hypothetical protein